MSSEIKNQEHKATDQQTIIINQQAEKSSNGMGITGLVLSVIALVLCWVPGLGQILGFLGFLFSCIGVFKRPRGMAIAGLIVSFFDFLIQVFFLAAVGAALSV